MSPRLHFTAIRSAHTLRVNEALDLIGVELKFIVEEMLLLLDLFEPLVPDKESNRLVHKFCMEKHRWEKAHGLHTTIRDRTSRAEKNGNRVQQAQYLFEESIAKTLYNLTRSSAPFDPDSPYWVIKNALSLSKELEVPLQDVVDIVS